jgi:hypothetical protein
MANIYDMVDVWNASGTTFTAIKMNVTDTASAAGSLLMDLQVGGSSLFTVNKSGTLNWGGTNTYFLSNVTGAPTLFNTNTSRHFLGFAYNVLKLASDLSIVWTSTAGNANGTQDLFLLRDAADTLAQRRTTNAQAFNLYNTFTDASNYERGFMKWDSNILKIGAEKLGTGTARALEFQTDGVTRLSVGTTGAVRSFGDLTVPDTARIDFIGRTRIRASADGNLRVSNSVDNDFDRLQLGGTSSSFPALKRSTTSLQARLADDSAFTNIQGKLTTETAYTAGAPTATGYIVLYDSTGTAYKVPAEAL